MFFRCLQSSDPSPMALHDPWQSMANEEMILRGSDINLIVLIAHALVCPADSLEFLLLFVMESSKLASRHP